jgi:hypothetical protein
MGDGVLFKQHRPDASLLQRMGNGKPGLASTDNHDALAPSPIIFVHAIKLIGARIIQVLRNRICINAHETVAARNKSQEHRSNLGESRRFVATATFFSCLARQS